LLLNLLTNKLFLWEKDRKILSKLCQRIEDYKSASKATKVAFYAYPKRVQFSAPEQKLTYFAKLIK